MKEERIIRGVMASAGVAIGRAIRTFDPLMISYNFHIAESETAKEVARFRASVEKSRRQLERMQAELRQSRIPESSFLVDAHLLILQDKLFVDRIVETIQDRAVNAEWAIQQVSEELYAAYDRLQDDYLRERRGDLEDIVRRMLHNLRSKSGSTLPTLPYDAILVGKTISPSTLFELRANRVVGIVTESGSPLSHTAIVARSLGLPAVMGVQDLSGIAPGDLLVVNGTRGMVIGNPDPSTVREYRQRMKQARSTHRRRDVHIPAVTQDGIRISLGTNINFSEEARTAVENGTEFIGLYRTEFDFFREEANPPKKN